MRESRYDPLFEPVKIGPVTAPNRFYQVPHCNGMGYRRPQMHAAMRGMKAAGGWGVVCTEYCSIHPSCDEMPYPQASLWDAGDVSNLRLMTDAVHAEGSLAGVQLFYGGRSAANMYTRLPSLGLTSLPNRNDVGMPVQTQAMTHDDIQTLKGWFQAAARRALEADFDIVYVYATHHYLLHDFLSPVLNNRTDEYGGSVENRLRLVREIIEETLETVGHRCAVAVRYSLPATKADDEHDPTETFRRLAELPDLWDVTVDDYSLEMGSSRFVKEASNQAAVAKIKSMTSKPVVSVGRFTSPDTMLSQINNGVQDFIGAARPSIADPFLPKKIAEGRLDDIRECIGCNICYAHNSLGSPIRCTQNPTMGEEWRRGWHADQVPAKHADETILVIGSGPAGLEAACTLGQRGYSVILAEADKTLGGRVTLESQLPGLSEWARVRDWRIGQIVKMPNVDVYPDNKLQLDSVLELGTQHILVATGSTWRNDGIGRWYGRQTAFDGWQQDSVISVNRILGGEIPKGRVIIYDDDHYYLSSAVALKLRALGVEVLLVTPESRAAGWSAYTEEQFETLNALYKADVECVTDRGLVSWDNGGAIIESVITGEQSEIYADSLIPLTARLPNDGLLNQLRLQVDRFESLGGISIQGIGDVVAPGIIAAAVYSGHKAARELGEASINDDFASRDTVVVK
jgi:dimethylamine/trimethylamine dehydrogenase